MTVMLLDTGPWLAGKLLHRHADSLAIYSWLAAPVAAGRCRTMFFELHGEYLDRRQPWWRWSPGCIGFFVVVRGASFAAHALPLSAFPGAAAATLLGVNQMVGLVAFSAVG